VNTKSYARHFLDPVADPATLLSFFHCCPTCYLLTFSPFEHQGKSQGSCIHSSALLPTHVHCHIASTPFLCRTKSYCLPFLARTHRNTTTHTTTTANATTHTHIHVCHCHKVSLTANLRLMLRSTILLTLCCTTLYAQ
jgi:hypothetical protein